MNVVVHCEAVKESLWWLLAATWLSQVPVAAGSHHYRQIGFSLPQTNVLFEERTTAQRMVID